MQMTSFGTEGTGVAGGGAPDTSTQAGFDWWKVLQQLAAMRDASSAGVYPGITNNIAVPTMQGSVPIYTLQGIPMGQQQQQNSSPGRVKGFADIFSGQGQGTGNFMSSFLATL